LTPGLLQSRLRHAEARLSAQRLNPALLAQRLRHDRQRLDGVTRIMASLNPDNVLARGYVRVTASDGRTLTNREAAMGESSLTLHFRDGVMDVTPGHTPAPREAEPAAPKRPAPAPRAKTTPPTQDDLFG
jgi:exodeoxyribonuclease VII large subunit